MPGVSMDDLGPVDYLVVQFPPGRRTFSGEMATELARLSSSGVIRVLDLLVIQKAEDGSVEGFELEDLEQSDEPRTIEREVAEVLAAEDVDRLAAAMEPGATAGVVVWENRWAAHFRAAVRRAGGQLISSGRVPAQEWS